MTQPKQPTSGMDEKAFEAACNIVEANFGKTDDNAKFHDVGALRGYCYTLLKVYEAAKQPTDSPSERCCNRAEFEKKARENGFITIRSGDGYFNDALQWCWLFWNHALKQSPKPAETVQPTADAQKHLEAVKEALQTAERVLDGVETPDGEAAYCKVVLAYRAHLPALEAFFCRKDKGTINPDGEKMRGE